MTNQQRKELSIQMAKKFELGHMLGKVYLSSEGLDIVMNIINKEKVGAN